MKQILFVFAATVLCGNLFGQLIPTYKFRKPISVNATTWKFASVKSGVDAIVTITGSKNASVDQIDDSSVYANAWQPAIKIGSTTNNASDSSYVEFNISFQSSFLGLPSIQPLMAMTIVDNDGSNNFREMVKVSLPAVSKNIVGSSLIQWLDLKWLNTLSGTTTFSNIDTSIYQGMTQVNFALVTSYKMRVGVVGKISANTVRQASFYFKPFSALVVALPVSLTGFNARLNQTNTELSWSTSLEDNLNRFEVYRSLDGQNYSFTGVVNAHNNSKDLINYNFTDFNVTNLNSNVVYYKLKMVDNEGQYKWSDISKVRLSADLKPASVSLYPNPTTEFVNLTLSETPVNDIQVSIVDAFGKNIQTVSNPEMTSNNVVSFDVRNLVNGIYFINIQNADGSSTSSKFIKR